MPISRSKLFQTLGVVRKADTPFLDTYTHKAYADLEEKTWRQNLDSSPHGHPWFTSFHGSQFPGYDMSCGRFMIYTMMNIPEASPFEPRLRAQIEIGKSVENQLLYRWGKAGLLIAGVAPTKDGDSGTQQGFEDPETWLTGSIDAIMGLPDYPYVLPVDVKSKSKEVIDKMKLGTQGYYNDHYAQVQAYIYLCDKFYGTMNWEAKGWGRPKGAVIYYASRENPRHTHEFFVEKDDEFIDRGVNALLQLQENWKTGILPQRPKDWKWMEDPCKWCRFKKNVCKPDWKKDVVSIDESAAIEFTKKIRPTYNIEDIKKGVSDRWN